MSKSAWARKSLEVSSVLQRIRQGQKNDAGLFGWPYSHGLDECPHIFFKVNNNTNKSRNELGGKAVGGRSPQPRAGEETVKRPSRNC